MLCEADRAHSTSADHVDHLVIVASGRTGAQSGGSSSPAVRHGGPVDVLRLRLLDGPKTLIRVIDGTVGHAYALGEYDRKGGLRVTNRWEAHLGLSAVRLEAVAPPR